MTEEAAAVYHTASQSMNTVLLGFGEWAKTFLTDNQKAEALYQLPTMV